MGIEPEGEELRKAVKWISEQRQEEPNDDLGAVIEAAAIRFNLSPKDTEFLTRRMESEGD